MTSSVEWFFVFLAMAGVDVIWALYTKAIADGRAHLSSMMAIGIVLFGGSVIIEYTRDPWLLIPASVGAYVGTYITAKGWVLKWAANIREVWCNFDTSCIDGGR